MSSSSETIFDILNKVPNDQYSCTECDSVPEIINIDCVLATIEINCPIHGKKVLKIEDYFKGELQYLYYNYKCNFSGKIQKNFLKGKDFFIFNCEPKEKIEIFCKDCISHSRDKNKLIKVNELNCTCKKHLKKYTKYCIKCKKHFCDNKTCKCEHDGNEIKTIEIQKATNANIDKLLIAKLLNTIFETYEKHPSNYFHTLNINNLVDIIKNKNVNNNYEYMLNEQRKIYEGTLKEQIEKYENILKEERDKQAKDKELLKKALNKIKFLEKQILEIVNVKLDVKLVGDEIKIDLNNKNVKNIDLKLLSLVPFKKLEEMNLSNNDISDIEPLKNFKSPLKKLDLSFNKINELKPLKEIIEKQKENTPDKQLILQKVNLDGNNLLPKQIDEIKRLLSDGLSKKVSHIECNLVYEIYNSTNDTIRILGKNFVNNNKNYCKIKDGDKQKEITEFYKINNTKKAYTLNLTLIIDDNIEDIRGMFSECKYLKYVSDFDLSSSNITNISDLFYECSSLTSLPSSMSKWNTSNVTDMSGLFYRCSSLESIPDISKWNTSNVINMMSIFNGCSSLKNLPDFSKWNVIKAKNISCMFVNCTSLNEMPKGISQWNTENVTNMGDMFNGCSKIRDLSELTNWNTSSVTSMKEMFKGCTSLTVRPDITKWNMKKVTNSKGMFQNCPEKYKVK